MITIIIINNIKKGQTVYYIGYFRGIGYMRNLNEAIITKVSKSHFNVDKYNRDCKKSTMRDGDCSDNHRQYFLSEKDYELFFERIRLERVFKQFAASSNHTEIPIDKLIAIVKIIEQ